MSQLGINIMLEDGHFVRCDVSEQEYFRIVSEWKVKMTSPSPDQFTQFLEGTGMVEGSPWSWCVAVDRIVGIHSFVMPPPQQQTSPQVSQGTTRYGGPGQYQSGPFIGR
jgi:hypothetical protein